MNRGPNVRMMAFVKLGLPFFFGLFWNLSRSLFHSLYLFV